jgi:Protein of unknown function (DUF3237)
MTLSLEHAFTITAKIAEAREIGPTPSGYRRVIGITGGTVAGPVLNGEVLPGGADWNVIRPDGAIHVQARYEILSDGGDIIAVTNDGFGPGRGRDAAAGRPAAWACPTRPCFETAAPALAWLNTASFVGELRAGTPGQVTIDVHRVLVS